MFSLHCYWAGLGDEWVGREPDPSPLPAPCSLFPHPSSLPRGQHWPVLRNHVTTLSYVGYVISLGALYTVVYSHRYIYKVLFTVNCFKVKVTQEPGQRWCKYSSVIRHCEVRLTWYNLYWDYPAAAILPYYYYSISRHSYNHLIHTQLLLYLLVYITFSIGLISLCSSLCTRCRRLGSG